METVLLFILLGLGSGALIAGIGLGVVATYRGSGVINLSTGAIAMLGGYAFWSLTSGKIASLPHLVALPLALLFVLAVGALLEFAVYRPLRNASPLGKLIASLGVLLIAQSSMLLAFGTTQQPSPSVLPTKLIHMLGSGITLDRFLLAAIVIAATAVLAAVYRWTKFGLATRAASENEVAAMLGGVSPGTISLEQLADRRVHRRLARHPRLLGHPARPVDAAAADHPGAGRRADRPVHLLRPGHRRGLRHRHPGLAAPARHRASPGSRSPAGSRFPARPTCSRS